MFSLNLYRSKRKNQIGHARKRANTRLGFDLTKEKNKQIVQMIQMRNKNVEFIRRQTGRISIFKVTFEGLTFQALYDKHRKTIVTVFPFDFEITDTMEE